MTLGKQRLTRLDALLVCIALVAAVPRLILGATQYIEYDGYWHIFVAIQDNWQQFLREYQSNFHPPLFYLLLKAAIWFGNTHLIYRAVSIVTGVAAVYVVGKIAQKVSLGPYIPAAAALVYGLALPGIIVSCEVRSYMLSEFFVLLSLYYFLDVLSPEATIKSRVLFALSAVVAGYSHYYAFFYVLACMAVAALFDVFTMKRRILRRLALDAAMFAAAGCALAYIYLRHGRQHAGIANHLRTFYFQPGGEESVTHFLLRNLRHLFGLFSPFPVDSTPLFFAVVAVSVLGTGWLVYVIRQQGLPENAGAGAVLLTTVLIFAGIMAGGLAGVYPFGGDLRQQFILFPMAVLCGCILLDRVSSGIHNRRTALAVIAVIVALAVGGWVRAFWLFPRNRTELATSAMRRFHKNFPAPQAVFVDQFNLINFFIHHHDWKWRLVKHDLAGTPVDVYKVSRGRDSLLLLRNPHLWNLNFEDPALYRELDKCMRAQFLPSLTIFYTPQVAAGPFQQNWRMARRIVERAAGQAFALRNWQSKARPSSASSARAAARPR